MSRKVKQGTQKQPTPIVLVIDDSEISIPFEAMGIRTCKFVNQSGITSLLVEFWLDDGKPGIVIKINVSEDGDRFDAYCAFPR